jgi:hypothetical protein
MFRSDKDYLALALVTTSIVSCGGGKNTTDSSGSGGNVGSTSTASSSSSSSSGSGGGVPDGGMPCPKSTVLAVKKLYLGDGNSGQWKTLGFNLDGKVSTAASTDLCKVNSGAMPSVPYPDGNQGIDNSFGKNLLPLILGIDPTWVTDINNSILQGNFTALLEIECLPPTGDVPVLTTKLFAGAPLGMMPKWDGTDTWSVEPDLLSNPMDPESSSIIFPQCSVMGTAFNAGKNGTFVLTIPITTQGKSTSLKLTLYAAQLTMTLAADRKSATGGIVGGVLNTEDFVTQVKNVGSLLGLCANPLLANLETQVRQASDIMADGSQDPTQTCNGISVGLGFDLQEAQLGGVGPAAPVEMTCP